MMMDTKTATEISALMREQDSFDRGMRARVNELRDQFAMAALTGLCANPDYRANKGKFAVTAYELAEEMLAARGGKA